MPTRLHRDQPLRFLDQALRTWRSRSSFAVGSSSPSDAGETHLARARNLYWGYLDYDGALRELEIARQSLPGEDWIFSLKGYIERRQGRWEECICDLERATELDPRNVLTLQQLALTFEQLRRYAEEKSTFERILAFEPNDPVRNRSTRLWNSIRKLIPDRYVKSSI